MYNNRCPAPPTPAPCTHRAQVASIGVAVETLKVAEQLTQALRAQLAAQGGASQGTAVAQRSGGPWAAKVASGGQPTAYDGNSAMY